MREVRRLSSSSKNVAVDISTFETSSISSHCNGNDVAMNYENAESFKRKIILCPMCKKPLRVLSENRFILKCNQCSITFAVGEIIEQDKMNFCVFANKCVIYDPFTNKRRTRIFCKEYKDFNSIDFCKRSCEYRTPPYKTLREEKES